MSVQLSTRTIFIANLLALASAGVFTVWTVRTASAQTFLEPSTPLGGTTAAPLNSANTTQRKLGSLIIGDGGEKLCLNTNTVGTDVNFCIASWTDLGSLVGGYVVLNTEAWVDTTGDGIPDPGTVAQPGYARLKANGTTDQLNTIIAEASSANNSAAVYATDSGNSNGWAAYFSGRVFVGDLGTAKELCLNSVAPLLTCAAGAPNAGNVCTSDASCGGVVGACTQAASGKGCITSWSDVSGALSGSYVKLQAAPGPLSVQVGGEALTGAGVFGTDSTKVGGTVLGTPASGTNVCYTCGDGICDTGEATAGCVIGSRPVACTNVPIPSTLPVPGPGGDC